jgi:hypothetical protein
VTDIGAVDDASARVWEHRRHERSAQCTVRRRSPRHFDVQPFGLNAATGNAGDEVSSSVGGPADVLYTVSRWEQALPDRERVTRSTEP